MKDTARLTDHPRDGAFALLHIGPAHAATMGRFAPARWSADLKAFILHIDQADAIVRYLAIHDVAVADDRGRPDDSDRPHGPLPECAICQQPARRDHEPERCPNCGEPWTSVVFTETKGFDWRPDPRICSSCGTENRLAFPRCHSCGAELPALRPTALRPPAARPHLDDPQPIGEAIAEWIDGQQPDEEAS